MWVLLLFFAALLPAASRGQGKDGGFSDLQGLIDKQIADGNKRVVIPPGRYRVEPKNGVHLSFKGLENREIVADGVEMICTQTTRALDFENCRDVRLSGLTIDYDPLPFSEGRITKLASNKSWMEFALIDGYPENRLSPEIEIYDATSRELQTRTYFGWRNLQNTGPRTYQVSKKFLYWYQEKADTEKVGDIVVIHNESAPGGAKPHAVNLYKCRGLVLADVSIFSAFGFGVFETYCDGTSYLSCRIDRRPSEGDYQTRKFPRVRSVNADGFHVKAATRGPILDGCIARYNGDDGVNIHGVYYPVLSADGATLRVASIDPDGLDLQAGDPVRVLTTDGAAPAAAAIKAVAGPVAIDAGESAWLRQRKINETFLKRINTGEAKAWTLTLDHALAVAPPAFLWSPGRVGEGFVVRNCQFGHNRSRGMVIRAGRGEIGSNEVAGTWGAGVLVDDSLYWLEAGLAHDLLIAGNTFDHCGGASILVRDDEEPGLSTTKVRANIQISGNTFSNDASPLIHAGSVDGLTLTGNVVRSGVPDFASAVEMKSCHHVTQSNNR